jgi:two-component system CheB/CheR fusion protein
LLLFDFKDAGARAVGESEQPLAEEQRRLRALVVDDEPDIRLMLDLFLRNAGYTVSGAPSALAALEIVGRETEPFDLVVSDIGMPGMDGYQLAEALRRLPGYAAVPMIAITGFVEFSDRERALHSGFHERLTKPIKLDLLNKLVRRLNSSNKQAAS